MVKDAESRQMRINEFELERLKAQSGHKDMRDKTIKNQSQRSESPFNKAPVAVGPTEYEEQYNANHDFAIFKVGNNKVGGLMDIKEKQNIADSIDN